MVTIQFISNEAMLNDAFLIRQKVFVEEQMVAHDIEYDEFENSSRHFLATVDGIPAGVARWRFTEKGIKLERFAVLKEYRAQGIGQAILQAVLADLGDKISGNLVYLHAQNQVIPFYEKNGFKVTGGEFEEADILHHKMIYSPRV